MTSELPLKIVFGIAFALALTIFTRTARRPAGLGVVFYAALGIWLFASRRPAWAFLWSLQTGGPYRFVRDPIYLAFVGIMLLLLLVSAHWVLGAAGRPRHEHRHSACSG